MKCDELKAYKGDVYIPVYGSIADAQVYIKEDVDAAIAELKEFAEDACLERDDNQNAIDELQAENEELKQKLHDAEMRADLAECAETERKIDYDNLKNNLSYHARQIYFKHNRQTIRALWLARAEWARSSALSYHLIESHPNKDVSATYKRKANKWEKVKDKCIKKAEEYK